MVLNHFGFRYRKDKILASRIIVRCAAQWQGCRATLKTDALKTLIVSESGEHSHLLLSQPVLAGSRLMLEAAPSFLDSSALRGADGRCVSPSPSLPVTSGDTYSIVDEGLTANTTEWAHSVECSDWSFYGGWWSRLRNLQFLLRLRLMLRRRFWAPAFK